MTTLYEISDMPVIEFATAYQRVLDADTGLTAAVRRAFGFACGHASGELKKTDGPLFSPAEVNNALRIVVLGASECGATVQSQSIFNGRTRKAVERIIKMLGLKYKVQSVFRLPESTSTQESKVAQPQFVSGDWIIGLSATLITSDVDEFEDTDQTPNDDNASNDNDDNAYAERQAEEAEEQRQRDLITGMAHAMATKMVEADSAYGHGQADMVNTLIGLLPEIVTAHLAMANDRDLVSELKSRGFSVRRQSAKSK